MQQVALTMPQNVITQQRVHIEQVCEKPGQMYHDITPYKKWKTLRNPYMINQTANKRLTKAWEEQRACADNIERNLRTGHCHLLVKMNQSYVILQVTMLWISIFLLWNTCRMSQLPKFSRAKIDYWPEMPSPHRFLLWTSHWFSDWIFHECPDSKHRGFHWSCSRHVDSDVYLQTEWH